MNMNQIVSDMENRMIRIEETLEKMATNHLSHIEQYTRWTLIGIILSTSLSLVAVALTI